MTNLREEFNQIDANIPRPSDDLSLNRYVGHYQRIRRIDEDITSAGDDATFEKEAKQIKHNIDIISTEVARLYETAEQSAKSDTANNPNIHPITKELGSKILLNEKLMGLADETAQMVRQWMRNHP